MLQRTYVDTIFSSCITNSKLNLGLPWQRQHSTGKKIFTSKLHLNLRNKLVKCYILSTEFNGPEPWTLRKVDQKRKVLKCGAGEGWRRSV
jgi:hypothetical protein